MDVVIVLVFVSLVLVTAAVALFIMRVKAGDFEHGDRLSLLPLDDEQRPAALRPKRADGSGEDGDGEGR